MKPLQLEPFDSGQAAGGCPWFGDAVPLRCRASQARAVRSRLRFDPYGGTAQRWGEEEFLAERPSVFPLDGVPQARIHLLPFKQPGQGCVVRLEARSGF